MKKSAFTAAIVIYFAITLSVFSQGTLQTLVLRPGPADGIDADIRTDYPQTPRGWSPDFIANAWTAQGNFFIQRSLLKFDLSQVPVTATIMEATLFLYTNLNTGHYQLDSGANAAKLLRVTQPWSEDQVTWENQPAYSAMDPVNLPQSITHTQNYEVDVALHVADMVRHPGQNFGWIFKLDTEERYRCMVFASSDNTMAEWRPTLVVKYTDCSDPVADFTFNTVLMDVRFTDLSNHATSWLWNFGDSSTSTDQNPTHTYAHPGNYTVCLTVSDTCGEAFRCDTLSIDCTPPVALFTFDHVDTTVSFFDATQSANPFSWLWDFGDGTTSVLQNPVHEYSQYGIYSVCLTVTDSCGAGTGCMTVGIPLPLHPGFTCTQHETNDLNVSFHDNSTGASNWLWAFGDGHTSPEQNPVHAYSQYGDYSVCLTAGNQFDQETACNPLKIKKSGIDAKGNSIVCYPNPYPGTGAFYFILFEDAGQARITISDMAGRLILNKEFRNLQKDMPVELDLSGLGKGTYLVEGSFNTYKRILKVEVCP